MQLNLQILAIEHDMGPSFYVGQPDEDLTFKAQAEWPELFTEIEDDDAAFSYYEFDSAEGHLLSDTVKVDVTAKVWSLFFDDESRETQVFVERPLAIQAMRNWTTRRLNEEIRRARASGVHPSATNEVEAYEYLQAVQAATDDEFLYFFYCKDGEEMKRRLFDDQTIIFTEHTL